MYSKSYRYFMIFHTASIGYFVQFLSFLIWKYLTGTLMVVTNTSKTMFYTWELIPNGV